MAIIVKAAKSKIKKKIWNIESMTLSRKHLKNYILPPTILLKREVNSNYLAYQTNKRKNGSTPFNNLTLNSNSQKAQYKEENDN